MAPGRVLNQAGCPGCQGDEKDAGLRANPGGTQGSGRRCARIGQAAIQVREWARSRAQERGEGSSGGRRREAGSVPYRALGTSTGPRPPPGPASTSPPYFSSISGLRNHRRCPCRRVSSCLAAAAELRTQAHHSPMAAASSGPCRPGRRCRCPWNRLPGTRASGLGREQFRQRRVPGSRTGADVARPRHPTQQPSLSGSGQPRACAQHNSRLPLPFLRLLPPRGDWSNPCPL